MIAFILSIFLTSFFHKKEKHESIAKAFVNITEVQIAFKDMICIVNKTIKIPSAFI